MNARVFPRRTKATPTDDLAFVGYPGLFAPHVDEIHVSVTFTWDLPLAEKLAKAWEPYGAVKIGGPATGMRGEQFTPGMYLKPGYTITSRGCPNRCWFCSVPQREGNIRELPIMSGNNVLDDNLLACSETHIRAVFDMLSQERGGVQFTGGLEAARLQDWHVEALAHLKPKQMFFALDTPNDLEPLRIAGKKLIEAGITKAGHSLRCFVLIGYPRDTMEKAETRIREAAEIGFMPMAMLWRDEEGMRNPEWRTFQRYWARPASVHARLEKTCVHF